MKSLRGKITYALSCMSLTVRRSSIQDCHSYRGRAADYALEGATGARMVSVTHIILSGCAFWSSAVIRGSLLSLAAGSALPKLVSGFVGAVMQLVARCAILRQDVTDWRL